MKTFTITLALAFIVSASFAQTTIPVKDKSLIEKITKHGDNLKFNVTHDNDTFIKEGVIIRFYDYFLNGTDFNGKPIKVWVVKYHGKWYSNFPYTAVFSDGRHSTKVYENGKIIYSYDWEII